MNLIETQKFALRQAQDFTERLAVKAGALLLKKFGHSKIKVQKGPSDFATDADLASEKLIIKEIKKHFPEDEILAEESNYHEARSLKHETRTWVIDPLDGTKNFHFGLPNWCVSIALQIKGKSVVGVVYAPVAKQLFSARKGAGAKLNGQKIHVSTQNKIEHSLILAEIPRRHTSGQRFARDLAAFTKSLNKVQRVRAFASAAYDLALVARGAADGYLDFSRNTKIWDIAAGELLIREAGGRVSDVTLPTLKFPNVSILATNGKLHGELLKLL
ncbi:MAG: inositol monophosphatase [Candidatus Peribacteraceae bacterium]|nr:inositol monophosphatase [Candidatus Peribacteraceae bacterium]